jgi:ubiquinol-cytochrome c reductase subunit 8
MSLRAGNAHLEKRIELLAISPYRYTPMQGALKSALFGGYHRILAHLPYWLIPIGSG